MSVSVKAHCTGSYDVEMFNQGWDDFSDGGIESVAAEMILMVDQDDMEVYIAGFLHAARGGKRKPEPKEVDL